MKRLTLFLIIGLLFGCTPIQKNISTSNTTYSIMTPYEANNNTTATYFEAITFYRQLAQRHEQLKVLPIGQSDVGQPLHLVVLSKDKDFDPVSLRQKGKMLLFINNAIHPGEPCGVDASMMLIRDYLTKTELQPLLDKVVLAVIPFYNIGGGLNRNSTTRANQNGPVAYGFRGNAQNLDLNRDFIKCDSKNAKAFNETFTAWQPHVFIDNHTSNGADYQYSMTLIPTQHNKLAKPIADYMNQKMLPHLFAEMKKVDWEMTPYVYARNTPDDGIAGFLDLPRYSSGYGALHNVISFMPETHMLKPYKNRVESTYHFMDIMIKWMNQDEANLKAAKSKTLEQAKSQKEFDINWTLDTEKVDSVQFKGYEAKYKKSEVSGLDRLYYDHSKPYTKFIPFFNTYKTTQSIVKPIAYIIPQSNHRVIDRLKWNKVEMKALTADTEIEVEIYYIEDYESRKTPYEGHYLHSNVKVRKETQTILYKKGDKVVYTNQAANRFIIETLEPQAPDSYFAWNFFDGILQRKEYFSPYVFEDLAADILKSNPQLKAELEKRKAEDEKFAKSAYAQLDFIYQRSPHSEITYKRYPVGRLVKNIDLN